ncbi:MAG: dihydrolipoamide acetyltransferase family protein [Anaerolineae bacterium]|nr:2-oxo acid dehydrogenase subunit E2 [Thermoflexales bacterium]MDW8396558.1 dihydrolipoamide acetyltransferase family protein [Anaerolineae bacterium]
MATNITMPQMGFDMTEGTIAAWLKKEGDPVTRGEAIAEIETDKTTIQIEAFSDGILRKIVAQPGQKVPVGEVIAIIADPNEVVEAASPSPVEQPTQTPALVTPPAPTPVTASGVVTESDRVIATPVARRIAQERGVDLRLVKGTGPEGRITKADVEAFILSATPAPTKVEPPAPVVVPPPPPVPVPTPVAAPPPPVSVSGEKQPLTRMRQTIATRMVASKQQVPHFYITVSVEMDAALALREQINAALQAEGVKVSVNDMVIRAAALALRRFPNLNASFAGDGIQRHDQVNVGVAVSVPDGLVTVTVRDADKKSLRQISLEMAGLAARAREGKMQPADYGGQTFTISNLGMYRVDNFIAIVNQPDAAILAVATAQPAPVVREGQIVIRTMMNMTLSGDHRVTDGAEAAQFLNEIKRLLENPWGLVL